MTFKLFGGRNTAYRRTFSEMVTVSDQVPGGFCGLLPNECPVNVTLLLSE